MTFSKRADWTPLVNRLTAAREGRELLDLTQSNPTRAGVDYPLDELADAMARGARASYEPDPRGLRSAREALGEPDQLILTASTSEAYSFLFKLFCNAGDNVITATPSYPLFEHLAGLELIELRTFALELHKRWELHASRIAERIDDRTQAIIVVNPNNPTGSFVTPLEQAEIASLGLPVISDEVFVDYGSGTPFVRDDVLTFTLGGLSKSCGLPHYKLGWIRVHGPGAEEALHALELIADNYLSASTPVQAALPDLLRVGALIRDRIWQRVQRNLDHLRKTVGGTVSVLPFEGGWSAVLRVPRIKTDEELAIELIENAGVLVQPGYFFDFETDGFLVVSLLTQPDVFDQGIARIVHETALAT